VRAAGGGNPIGKWLQQALDDEKAELFIEGTKQKIRYKVAAHVESYDDPEEWVRADFWAELIYRLEYPEERIAVEVAVPDRTPGDYADLAVCHDDARKTPYIVVEVKAEGITQAEFDQAVEQAVGNGTWSKLRADYVMVVAGTTRRVLDVVNYAIGERSSNVVADLPVAYQPPEAFRFAKSGIASDPDDIQRVSRDEMISILRKCHDTLWGGRRLSPPQAFSELCKVIFVKIADENQTKRGDHYQVQIKSGETAKALAKRIDTIYATHRRKEPDIFTSDIAVSPEIVMRLVEHIQGVSISATDIDVKGLAFERFMDSFFKGDFGQYFTPREIIRFAVEMIDVEPEEFVLDPACGSAGFLLHALELVKRKADEYQEPGSPAHFRMWSDFANQQLFGIEINDEIARVAKMNMILHGDGHTNVVCADALVPEKTLVGLNRGLKFGAFDVVLTNVPFGAKIRLEERPFLADFDNLGNTHTKSGRAKPRKTQVSEIIFIERIWQLLRPSTGRAAVVLPDGILTNERASYVREFILDHFQVLAVVSLPVSAFMHYGAGVKASVVFLRKLDNGESPPLDEPVFLAEAELVGYDATGRQGPTQLPEILDAYHKFRDDPAPDVVDIPTLAVAGADDDGQ
jgi:type I restriction enzyme M protein